MTIKSRLDKLEKRMTRGDGMIHIFYVDQDGGAITHQDGKEVKYTAAEYTALQKEWEARGEKILQIRRASDIDSDIDYE